MMSKEDKINLDTLMDTLTGGNSSPSTVIKTLQDVLDILSDYPKSYGTIKTILDNKANLDGADFSVLPTYKGDDLATEK